MVGSVTEIFMALGMVILLAGVLKYTFGSTPTGALPDETGDLGLLETVTVVATRDAAEVLRARLAREGVRVTVSRGVEGWRLLAFPTDVDDAKVALRAL